MEIPTLTGRELDKFGYMIGVKRKATEDDDAYRNRMHVSSKSMHVSTPFHSAPQEDITLLVDYIKEHFPNGCRGIHGECDKCPLNQAEYNSRTTEHCICTMLNEIDYITE